MMSFYVGFRSDDCCIRCSFIRLNKHLLGGVGTLDGGVLILAGTELLSRTPAIGYVNANARYIF